MKLFLANQMENIPSQEETMLGVLDHDAVCSSLEALTNKKKRKNSTFSEEEHCQIGQVPFRRKNTAKLDNMLQFMDLLPL